MNKGKKIEKMYINRYYPLLNKVPWHPFKRSVRKILHEPNAS